MEARQLPPPELIYKDMGSQPKVMRVTTGEWNLRGLKFHTGAKLGPFAVCSFDNPNREAGGPAESETSVEVCVPTAMAAFAFPANPLWREDLLQAAPQNSIHLRCRMASGDDSES